MLLQILNKEVFFNYLVDFSLLVDAGLVVLIWMVQLIIYPSFLFYENSDLLKWHQKYTTRIAVIVVPLMLFQLIFAILQSFYLIDIFSHLYLASVLFLWIFTLSSFAPIHAKITNGNSDRKLLLILIKRNWLRTFLWTFTLLFHILNS